MTEARRTAGVLRAEFEFGDVREIACAIELSDDSVFVITDMLPAVGTTVDLTLSFGQAIAPIAVHASVVQIRIGSGPGTPSGFLASFEGAHGEARERIRDVAGRLSASESRRPSGEIRQLRVLLVEDNRLIRDMFDYAVGKYFAARRGRVILDQAGDASTAWLKLLDGRYDVVIVDHYLPAEDGATLIGRLRKEPRLARTSVVAISVGGNDVRRATLSAGADVFLHKPIVLRDLFQTFEFLLHDGAADAGAA